MCTLQPLPPPQEASTCACPCVNSRMSVDEVIPGTVDDRAGGGHHRAGQEDSERSTLLKAVTGSESCRITVGPEDIGGVIVRCTSVRPLGGLPSHRSPSTATSLSIGPLVLGSRNRLSATPPTSRPRTAGNDIAQSLSTADGRRCVALSRLTAWRDAAVTLVRGAQRNSTSTMSVTLRL